MIEGSHYFRRFAKDLKRISPHFRLVKVKYGFYRIYWKSAYIHEVSKDMPVRGYDVEVYNPRLQNKSYYEEFEDNADVIQNVKNFREGYWDSLDVIKTRFYLLKHDAEFNKTSTNAYKQVVIK